MIDIVKVGADIGTFDTQTVRAKNILSVQTGSLEYAQTLGIDLKYFLSEDFKFQNESFKAYLVEVLANKSINVSSVLSEIQDLFTQQTFNLSSEDKSSGLVAR